MGIAAVEDAGDMAGLSQASPGSVQEFQVMFAARSSGWDPVGMHPDENSIRPSPFDERSIEDRILLAVGGLVAVDKPADLPSTGRKLDDPDCLQSALIEHFGQMVWAVHQLDADTSGVNLFVREKGQVAYWKDRMAFPNGTKTYLALVHGRVEFEARRIDAPIAVVSTSPHRQLGICEHGKRAVSEVRRLVLGHEASLVQVQIETGRTHQIRIHLASIGHPLLGEDWYAKSDPRAHHRQALHAWRVEFEDDPEPRRIESPLPGDLRELMQREGIVFPGES
ncbi:MAG: 23S rRNA-/tRNA-specific pseudouridylate synthase [Planctomycetota bacterium]|jgi:23S rRNA-/tRNA-specific pseudouridylate synthase